jgi:hypothetical protein
VAAELAKLNLTLKEIETLLRRQGESDELGLLIKRVELAGARLDDRERALKTAESERRSLDRRKGQLERVDPMAAELERAESRPALLARLEALTAPTAQRDRLRHCAPSRRRTEAGKHRRVSARLRPGSPS